MTEATPVPSTSRTRVSLSSPIKLKRAESSPAAYRPKNDAGRLISRIIRAAWRETDPLACIRATVRSRITLISCWDTMALSMKAAVASRMDDFPLSSTNPVMNRVI